MPPDRNAHVHRNSAPSHDQKSQFNLTSGPGRVGDSVVALLPVDELDLHALVGRADLLGGELGHLHQGSARGRLGQSVALEDGAAHAHANEVVGLFGKGCAS